MSRFIQLHLLTSYPPANLNRDDMGRPKTAKMGGVDRLRVSSQSLKRTWRTSELLQQRISEESMKNVFGKEIPSGIGVRSKNYSEEWVEKYLIENDIPGEQAESLSKDICRCFGAMEKDENKLSQLSHISDMEMLGFNRLVDRLVRSVVNKDSDEFIDNFFDLIKKRDSKKKSDDIKKANTAITKFLADEILQEGTSAVDVALFGRMLASTPAFNVEAACQVAHAISVHPVVIEDDYFTAVDDLNDHSEDTGAAHIGETGFAAGLFYSYICINKKLLLENLNGDEALASKAVAALTEAAIKVAPEGKQNSFGSRAYASYVLAEKGEQQPRSLSVAYLKPVNKNAEDYGKEAINALKTQRDNFDTVYGKCSDDHCEINALAGEGSLEKLLKFVCE